jgi:hypothetical protein
MHKIPLLFVFICIFSFLTFAQNDKKAELKDIIEKHLAAIGTLEKRTLNRKIKGDTDFRLMVGQSPTPNLSGKNYITSENKSVYFKLSFISSIYTYELFAFDGKELSYRNLFLLESSVRRERTGQQPIAPLTIFYSRYPEIVEYGLFGGILTSSWFLQNLENNPKIKCKLDSTKKIDGKEMFVIDVTIPGNSFKKITVFLDKSNYQHTRTEFKTNYYYKEMVTEEFTDFKDENGLTLPHKHKITAEVPSVEKGPLFYSAPVGSSEYEWKTTFTNFLFDQKFDTDLFRIKEK